MNCHKKGWIWPNESGFCYPTTGTNSHRSCVSSLARVWCVSSFFWLDGYIECPTVGVLIKGMQQCVMYLCTCIRAVFASSYVQAHTISLYTCVRTCRTACMMLACIRICIYRTVHCITAHKPHFYIALVQRDIT